MDPRGAVRKAQTQATGALRAGRSGRAGEEEAAGPGTLTLQRLLQSQTGTACGAGPESPSAVEGRL